MKYWHYTLFSILISAFPVITVGDVVINEINYDPIDIGDEGGGLREFVELYNPGPNAVNLTGYQFTNGITYSFPAGTNLAANGYLVIVKTPTHRMWRNTRYTVLGPYDGNLSNGGERITLIQPNGTIVERFSYDDDHPWSRGADGYGRTLERISWQLPADDYHSWRTSIQDEGTPGAQNSVIGVIPRPLISAHDITPDFPTSSDQVTVQFGIDSPQDVMTAYLNVETEVGTPAESTLVLGFDAQWKYWKGRTSPSIDLVWAQPSFNDSSWETGSGGFGYGDLNLVNTVLSDMQGNYSTLYLRNTFQVDADDMDAMFQLGVLFDDAFICYINGTEVARSNAPTVYSNQSIANGNHEAESFEVFSLNNLSTILRPGTNTIALVGFNVTLANSSDFVLTPALILSKPIDRSFNRIPMTITSETVNAATLEAIIPEIDSQTLVRFNLELELNNGQTLKLPHEGERRPFESYFVYDGEIESRIPILWIYNQKPTILPETPQTINAAVVVMPNSREAQVFDGVTYIRSENGNKLRFLKGEELRGDRTINIIPENPPFGGTAGSTGPFREFLGLWFYDYMDLLAPRWDWFRVIEDPGTPSESMTQRLIVQQINEKFLEMNGRSSETDLYKLEWNVGFTKHTNKDEGNESIQALLNALNTRNPETLIRNIEANLDVEQFLDYSVASVLTSNWDGFFNNNWMYQNPAEEGGKWEIIPWDLDKLWGFTDSQFMFVEMPVDFPLNGRAQQASRAAGPITGPFHSVSAYHEEYKRRLRVELDRVFAPNAPIHGVIDEWEQILLDDLALLEGYTRQSQTRRRNQITESMDVLREFIRLKRNFLNGVLPSPVSDWSVY